MTLSKVRITAVHSPTELKCLISTNEDGSGLMEFEQACDRFARSGKATLLPSHDYNRYIGKTVLAFSNQNKKYMPGRLKNSEGNLANVLFNDFSQLEKCSRVFAPVPVDLQQGPYKSYIASLVNVMPFGPKWVPQCNEVLKELIVDKVLNAFVSTDKDGSVYIDVFLNSDDNNKSVSSLLIDKQLAKYKNLPNLNPEFMPFPSLSYDGSGTTQQRNSPVRFTMEDRDDCDFEKQLLIKKFGDDVPDEPDVPSSEQFDISESVQRLKQQESDKSSGSSSPSRPTRPFRGSPKKGVSTAKPVTFNPSENKPSKRPFENPSQKTQVTLSKMSVNYVDQAAMDKNLKEYEWCLDQLKYNVRQVLVADLKIEEKEARLEKVLIDRAPRVFKPYNFMSGSKESQQVILAEIALFTLVTSWIMDEDSATENYGIRLITVLRATLLEMKKHEHAGYMEKLDKHLCDVLVKIEMQYIKSKAVGALDICDKYCRLVVQVCQALKSENISNVVWQVLLRWSQSRSVSEDDIATGRLLAKNVHIRGFYHLLSQCSELVKEKFELRKLFDLNKMWPKLPMDRKFEVISEMLVLANATGGGLKINTRQEELEAVATHDTHAMPGVNVRAEVQVIEIGLQTDQPASASVGAQTDSVLSAQTDPVLSAQTDQVSAQTDQVSAQLAQVYISADVDDDVMVTDPCAYLKRMLKDLGLEHLLEKLLENDVRDKLLRISEDDVKSALREAGVPLGPYYEIKSYLRKFPPGSPAKKVTKSSVQNMNSGDTREKKQDILVSKEGRPPAKPSVVERLFSPDYFAHHSAAGDNRGSDSQPQSPVSPGASSGDQTGVFVRPGVQQSSPSCASPNLTRAQQNKEFTDVMKDDDDEPKMTINKSVKGPSLPRRGLPRYSSPSKFQYETLPPEYSQPSMHPDTKRSTQMKGFHELKLKASTVHRGSEEDLSKSESDSERKRNYFGTDSHFRPVQVQSNTKTKEKPFVLNSEEFPSLRDSAASPVKSRITTATTDHRRPPPSDVQNLPTSASQLRSVSQQYICTGCGRRDHIVFNCPHREG